WIENLSQGVATSADAVARLDALQQLDTSTLEEFSAAGANRAAEQSERVQELRDTLLQQERDAAELEALRQEKAQREAEENAEALRQEGERRAADRLAKQEEARRQAELVHPQEDAAQRLAEQGEHRSPSETLRRPAQMEGQARVSMQQAHAPARQASNIEHLARERARMSAVLVNCLKGKLASEVATELLDGTFHPAVTVDISRLY
ncbi:MAG: hypothetical protein ACK587_15315, partial [Cyanobacteriota bacterium]